MSDFWSRVLKTDSCWIWQGSLHRQGYGRLGFRGNRSMFAHRVSWILTYGEIPAGYAICHSCDNPSCVRPDHLFLGTQKDNVADMIAKGRKVALRGPANNKAKLSEEEARRVKFGNEPLAPLSRELNISYQALYEIRRGRTWRHL